MPNTLTALEHFKKAHKYYWEGNRRGTIKEGRLALRLNPTYLKAHWLIGCVYLSTEPVDCEAALKEFANWCGKLRIGPKVTNTSAAP